MTLLAVWRDEQRLHIASDSRLSLGKGGYADTAVKIAPFRLQVHTPGMKGAPSVRRIIGMSASGDTPATAPVKETLRTLLESVSAPPGFDPSMLEVAQMAAHFLHTIWYRGQATISFNIVGHILLLGYCPAERRARAFSILTNRGVSPPRVDAVEVVTSVGEIQFFGSGANAASRLRTEQPALSPFEIVRAVIVDEDPDPKIRAVGGRVQYGVVEGTDFRLYPIIHYDIDRENRRAHQGIYLAGVEIYPQEPPPGVPRPAYLPPPFPDGFVLTGTAKDPFYADRLEIERSGYDMQPGYLFEDRIE